MNNVKAARLYYDYTPTGVDAKYMVHLYLKDDKTTYWESDYYDINKWEAYEEETRDDLASFCDALGIEHDLKSDYYAEWLVNNVQAVIL